MKRSLQLFIILVLSLPLQALWAQNITIEDPELISVALNGASSNADSGQPALSMNSAYVAFSSEATNLVETTTDGSSQIYVRNFVDDETALLSLSDGHIQGGSGGNALANAPSYRPSLSLVDPSGRFVAAFESYATNLVDYCESSSSNSFCSPSGSYRNIYIRVPSDESTDLVSFGRDFANEQVVDANGPSFYPSVTYNEKAVLVAYTSEASNLVETDLNQMRDVFISELKHEQSDSSGQSFAEKFFSSVSTYRITDKANGPSNRPRISGNGKFVVFESRATNLIPGTTTLGRQIYLWDRDTKQIALVSRNANGQQGNGASFVPDISYNGRFIVYVTEATNILSDSQSDTPNIVFIDRKKKLIARVNASAAGVPGNGTIAGAPNASVSPDGRFVIFVDDSSNLVDSDTNGVADVFMKKMKTGEIVRINTVGGVEANGTSGIPSLGGKKFNQKTGVISYYSDATNLVSNDTNSVRDIFITRITAAPPSFTNETEIEVPADVEIVQPSSGTSNKCNKLTVEMQEFSEVEEDADPAMLNAQGNGLVVSKKKTTLYYKVKVRKTGTKRKNRNNRLRLTKRNSVTLKKLSAGKYNVSYKVVTKKGGKRTSSTSSSPTQSVTIPKKS